MQKGIQDVGWAGEDGEIRWDRSDLLLEVNMPHGIPLWEREKREGSTWRFLSFIKV